MSVRLFLFLFLSLVSLFFSSRSYSQESDNLFYIEIGSEDLIFDGNMSSDEFVYVCSVVFQSLVDNGIWDSGYTQNGNASVDATYKLPISSTAPSMSNECKYSASYNGGTGTLKKFSFIAYRYTSPDNVCEAGTWDSISNSCIYKDEEFCPSGSVFLSSPFKTNLAGSSYDSFYDEQRCIWQITGYEIIDSTKATYSDNGSSPALFYQVDSPNPSYSLCYVYELTSTSYRDIDGVDNPYNTYTVKEGDYCTPFSVPSCYEGYSFDLPTHLCADDSGERYSYRAGDLDDPNNPLNCSYTDTCDAPDDYVPDEVEPVEEPPVSSEPPSCIVIDGYSYCYNSDDLSPSPLSDYPDDASLDPSTCLNGMTGDGCDEFVQVNSCDGVLQTSSDCSGDYIGGYTGNGYYNPSSGSGSSSGGSGEGDVPKLYESSSDLTLVERLSEKFESMSSDDGGVASGVLGSMGDLGISSSGECVVFTFDFSPLNIGLDEEDFSPPCWIFDIMRNILLLFSFLTARRLIFGG